METNNENMNKLTLKWLEKIQKGETINITDLYEFSKVKLKRSRIRKKFHKYYERYVSEEIKKTYWDILFSTPLVNSFKKQMDFKLLYIEPMKGPKAELFYYDYQYKPN
jgi:hypothetical protein